MGRITLSAFAETHGQEKAARLLGVTQGGLSKAIRTGRKIFVIQHADGTYTAEELRPFPSQKSAA